MSELRWRTASDTPLESLHLHLSADLVAATRAAIGDGSSPLPGSLDVDDQFIASAAESSGRALADGAPGIYADSVAQVIAAHVLYVARRRAPVTTHHRQG